MSKRLTDQMIERMPVPAKETCVFDSASVGLALKLTPGGRKVWISWLRFPGHKHQSGRTLGHFPAMKVGAARAKADLWHSMVQNNIDPAEVERAQRQAEQAKGENTFESLMERYIASRSKNRRAGPDAAEMRRDLLPALGTRPVHQITPRDIKELEAKLMKRSKYAARAAWNHATGIFQLAVHEELIEASPMASLSKRMIFRGVKFEPRERTLTDEELFALWRATERAPYPYKQLYRLLILTGCRLNELLRGTWSELHPDLRRIIREHNKSGIPVQWSSVSTSAKIMTVPKERYKTNSEHVIQLSDDACRVLETLPRFAGSDWLFSASGERGLWLYARVKKRIDKRMLRTLRALARRRGDDPRQVSLPNFVNHDMRRVVRSGLAALNIPDHISEMVLGHGRKGIQKTYDKFKYGPQIRAALEAWAGRVRSIVKPSASPPPDNVVALRAG